MSSTQLTARAPTDLWRKPPSLDVSNAPTHTLPLASKAWHRARVTVSASWSRQYDQGGLVIFLPSSVGGKRSWVKAGIEYVGGRAHLSVVAAREGADWSLFPIEESSVRIEFAREPIDEEKGRGPSLFVYRLRDDGGGDGDGARVEPPIRKITWAFDEEGEIEVGVYAARPTKLDEEDGEELTVSFDKLGIDFDTSG